MARGLVGGGGGHGVRPAGGPREGGRGGGRLLLEVEPGLLFGAPHARLERVERALHVLALLRELLLDRLLVAAVEPRVVAVRALLGVGAVQRLDAIAPQVRLGARDELVQLAAEGGDEPVLLEDEAPRALALVLQALDLGLRAAVEVEAVSGGEGGAVRGGGGGG